MFRFSLISSALIALFWVSWRITQGSVPDQVLALESPASRWWDILIGPIWSVALALVFTSDQANNGDRESSTGLIASLGVGMFFGLITAIYGGLDNLLFLGLIALALGVGVAFDLFFPGDLKKCPVLAIAIGFSIAPALAFGIFYGLVVAIGAILIIALTASGGIVLPLFITIGLAVSRIELYPAHLHSGRIGQGDIVKTIGAGAFCGLIFYILAVIVAVLLLEFAGPGKATGRTRRKLFSWLLAE